MSAASGSGSGSAAGSGGQQRQPEPDWKRRKRLAEVFGDAVPDTTSDEREPGSRDERPDSGRGDTWLKEQVPPHHGTV